MLNLSCLVNVLVIHGNDIIEAVVLDECVIDVPLVYVLIYTNNVNVEAVVLEVLA